MAMKMTAMMAEKDPLRCLPSYGDPILGRVAFLYRSVRSTASSAHTTVMSHTFTKPYSVMQAVEMAPRA